MSPRSVALAGRPPIPPFRCPLCHEVHEGGEPGFGLPDAAYALTLSAEEREVFAEYDNEDVAIVRDASFVRSVAYFPILGSPLWLGMGFWVHLPAEAFADFEAHERVSHPSYEGRIANQSLYFTPTLGLPVRLDFVGPGLRPSAVFTDPSHPLTRAQRTGIDAPLADTWRAECLHMGDPAPIDTPWRPDLATHGFEILAAEDVGREPATPARPPASGDKVKVGVSFLASDETGSPARLNAAWWIEVDHVQRPDLWGGTLANHPRVPATIHLGSRLWIEPRHVLQYAG